MVQDDEILTEFLIESSENLARLDEEMVLLEKDPTSNTLLSSVFRTIHTIKGTCGFLGFSNLEGISHRAENLLSEVRAGEQQLSAELVSAVLSAVDVIKNELAIIKETGTESRETQTSLLNLLQSLSCAERAKPATDEPEPGVLPSPALPSMESPITSPAAKVEPVPSVAKSDQELGMVKAQRRESAAGATVPGVAEEGAEKKPVSISAVDTTIRLDVSFLDKLVNLVGELVLARNEIAKLSAKADKCYQASSQRLNAITTELQASIMKTRMQPVGAAWGKIPRIVRDLATTCGKQIKLEMKGADTELDRAVVDAIRDPLIHIVRNSCDHGIESVKDRTEQGKPAEGTLELRAFHANGQVHIEIADDGRGLDPVRIKRKAILSGLLSEREAAAMPDKEAVHLICYPGFSTAETVTKISGRGVGMDVVKTSVEKMGGVLDLQSELGKGTIIKIRIPLTLAIVPGVIVGSRHERFILPQRNLIELLRFDIHGGSSPVEMIDQTPVLHWRGHILPLVDLGNLLKLPPRNASDLQYIAVLQGEEHYFGLLLDEVEDTQEIVVKPLDPELKTIATFAGASVLGDGEVCLILDVNGILRHSGLEGTGNSVEQKREPVELASPHELSLLCRVGDRARVAISLLYLDRLEEMPRHMLEYASGRLVMQYRGGVLPLVKLNEQLGIAESYDEDSENFALLVFRRKERSLGLVVRKVLDIVTERIAPESGAGGSFSYPAIIDGTTVDVLNIRQLLEQFDPSWFSDEATPASCEQESLTYA